MWGYFYPDDETLALISDGYLATFDIYPCIECWDILNHPCNDNFSDMVSEADPEL
jgi:hypothetical protein